MDDKAFILSKSFIQQSKRAKSEGELDSDPTLKYFPQSLLWFCKFPSTGEISV